MTASISAGPPLRLSVPPKLVAPRQLTDAEVGTLRAIADVLIPAVGDNPAATSEQDFDQWLARAADARADAFDDITAVLAQLDHAAPDTIDQTLRALHADQPRQFQALSAVVAGAWLLVRRCARGSDIPASGAIPRAWKKRPTRSPTASSTRPRPRPHLHARRHQLGLTPPCAGPRYSTAWNATSAAKSPSHDRRSRCGHSARDRPGGKHPRLTLLHLSLSRRAGTRIAGLQRRAPRKDQQEGRAAAAQVRGQMPVERPVTGPESDQDDHRG